MYITYLIFAVFILALFGVIIYDAIKKQYLDMFIVIFIEVFAITSLINLICGGSAIHNAQIDCPIYQAGQYYLVSHGDWTVVSYQKYLLVLISEITGIVSFAVGFVLCVIREIHKRFLKSRSDQT